MTTTSNRTSRCQQILDLIDTALADYERSRPTFAGRPAGGRSRLR